MISKKNHHVLLFYSKFFYLGRGGYVNEALVEDDVSSRILYPPDPDPRLDRARSQLSAVSKVNIPGAVSYK